ncbi:flagellar biosynthesis protein FlhA [Thermodesulfitimonas autotrophica]|uniref:Flagellar biosynthesis protein FlhA n=1 Tax=Thermodesulfitimonas autotrophica TaxID=1894989 RepID=A0A3N5B2C9_9THEO|nr:flagellar biosynthesis protein FlhA [Thermodesulfitimonas autotrophica]RPF42932.1 flagellar biosynthesis protein FlhA [Thermodesulfitimonas autotrophica]
MPGGTAGAGTLKRYGDLIIAGLVIGIVLLIVIPVPPAMLDILLVVSLGVSLLVLLITLFTMDVLEFSSFPTLLLILTLYRLALNISSTRLILGQAAAGKVIAAFGSFVVGGSYIVGFIVFLIITVIQFVVITNGANRVAEVAARFTLDAMPGKQMAIDGDFNAGLITEAEAKERRRRLQREADFFGAMDGATKFIRGDAIAGLVITGINIIGGLVIGLVIMRMGLLDALRTYTMLTIGDGLVTQIPALLVSTATGVLVTRSSAAASFGREISRQMSSYPRVLFVAAAIFGVLGLVPAMPNLLFLSMAGATGFLGYSLVQEEKRRKLEEQETQTRRVKETRREPENVLTYFQVDPLEIEIGYSLVPLTQEEQGGDLLTRVAAVRRQCAAELGIYVRPIRIRDNLQLKPNAYVFRLRGVEAARGELMPGYYLAMNPAGGEAKIKGIPTREPAFGLEAWWITAVEKEAAEKAGYTVVDATAVLATHLSEFIKRNAAELLGRQETKELLDTVKEKNAALIDELVPGLLSLGEVQKVLQNLLRERVPIRDLVGILEAVADAAVLSRDPSFLTERARAALARTITQQYAVDGRLSVLTVHPRLEQLLVEAAEKAEGGYPVLEPRKVQRIVERVKEAVEKIARQGMLPVILCSPGARLPLRRLTERQFPHLAVLSLNEIWPDVEVEAVGTVMWDED